MAPASRQGGRAVLLSTVGAESAADSDLCVACSGLRGRILFGSSARSVPNRAARLRGFERYRAIPAESARILSSCMAWAVIATMGSPSSSGMVRMIRVAS